jgi:hypothetical protein
VALCSLVAVVAVEVSKRREVFPTPVGAAGARATPPHPQGPQDRLRDYWAEGAAGCRRRAVGTAGPFQGLLANREQWTPLGQQYLSRNYGPDGSRRMAMLECTAASGRLYHVTFQERAHASVRCLGFWAKLLHADRPTRTGLWPGSK